MENAISDMSREHVPLVHLTTNERKTYDGFGGVQKKEIAAYFKPAIPLWVG
jgi:hypothetical protein